MTETEAAYIAGLFDGEGCVSYKQYMRKRPHNPKAYPTWQIKLEIAMTDKSILKWVHEILGVGTVTEKKYQGINSSMYLKKKAGDMSKSNKKVQSTIDMGKFVKISVYYLKSC